MALFSSKFLVNGYGSVKEVLKNWDKKLKRTHREEGYLWSKHDSLPKFLGYTAAGRVGIRVQELKEKGKDESLLKFFKDNFSDCFLSCYFSGVSNLRVSFRSDPKRANTISIISPSVDQRAELFTDVIASLELSKLIYVENREGTKIFYKIHPDFVAERFPPKKTGLKFLLGEGGAEEALTSVDTFKLCGLDDKKFAEFYQHLLKSLSKYGLKLNDFSLGCEFSQWNTVKLLLENAFSGPWKLEMFCTGEEKFLEQGFGTIAVGTMFPVCSYDLGNMGGVFVDAVLLTKDSIEILIQSSEDIGYQKIRQLEEIFAC
ncbi:hypothetical protein [Roseibacillus persicicus]|uniref:Uncharacterized protein n=1 Tax=Roseibacillus persicicus TaxID=454148 RepID=A0A918U0P1_9BACT|nr:hypothetical protein [Roseibacillus persicicus]GHC68311.1 hypothetical protein GCM10007100_40420 [Roseibacillus persicicus]